MLKFRFVPNPLKNPLRKLDLNFVSLSETIFLGIPCNLEISFMKNFAILVLHIKNTHFDSVASVVITKVASVASVKEEYCHDAYVVPVNDIRRTLGTCQTLDLEEEERLIGLMNLLPSKNTKKTKFLEGSAPL